MGIDSLAAPSAKERHTMKMWLGPYMIQQGFHYPHAWPYVTRHAYSIRLICCAYDPAGGGIFLGRRRPER